MVAAELEGVAALDRLDIERQQRAQVENLSVDAHFLDDRFGHMHHRAISEDGQRLALTHRRGLAEFDAVIILGHRARIMLRPRLDRTAVIAAERAVVDALGFEEYDGESGRA